MIGFLDGQVVHSRGASVVLAVGGVGYVVQVPSSVWTVASAGSQLALNIYTHQTADSTSLFGFSSVSELEFFEQLISVNGVGPKSALDILEQPIDTVRSHILAGDAKALGKTKGVGPKTAARIVLELRSKLTGETAVPDIAPRVSDETIHALVSLGYKKKDVEHILEKLPDGIQSTEDVVSWFLQQI